MKHDSLNPVKPAAVKSADRTFDVLEFVAAAAAPPGFSQLLNGLGIPRSSLFHLLNNMLARGYLEQLGPSGQYRLGPSIRYLAAHMAAPSLAAQVEPFLRRLSSELNETSGFYVRRGDVVEIVASAASSTQALTYTMRVGDQAPLYAVSAGKILLASQTPLVVEAYLDRLAFEAITPHTLHSRKSLRRQVAAARDEGFAYSREEFTPGITGIAIAVGPARAPLGALNLAVPSARFTGEREPQFRRELLSAANALARVLAP